MRTRGRKMRKSRKRVTRKRVTRKQVTRRQIRKRGGSAFQEPEHTPPEIVERILKEAGPDFESTIHDDVIDIFTKRPEQNLRDAIAAVNYIKGLKDSKEEDDQILHKIVESFSIESEHREWLNNRGLDYQSLRSLLKLMEIEDIPDDFKFPLVLTKYYQFYVLHKEGNDREEGLRIFKAAAKRMLRNAISMAKGLSKGPRTNAPMVLYRGLNISYEDYEHERMNDSYQYGFSSTSLNEGSAMLFVRGGFMMRIHVPTGTPISCYGLRGEFEIPLPIGSKFVVRKDSKGVIKHMENGILYIDFDIVLNDEGIKEVEGQYEGLKEKIEGFTEEQLTEVFRRSYPEYKGPGSTWLNSQANSQSSQENSQQSLYFPDQYSQELIDNAAHQDKKLRTESQKSAINELSQYDDELVRLSSP